jgi:hypothetical protein
MKAPSPNCRYLLSAALTTVMGILGCGHRAQVPLGQFFMSGSMPSAYTMSGSPAGSAPDSLILQSSGGPTNGFGTVMTDVDPTPYLGKRLELSGTVRAEGIMGWAGLWMRVDGSESEWDQLWMHLDGSQPTPLAFDNMHDRPLIGTLAASTYDVVLDVDPSASNIAYGVLLADQGEVTVSNLALKLVSNSVNTTQ